MNIRDIKMLLLVFILLTSCKENSGDEQNNPPEQEEQIYTLRVMTYNIYHGETNRRDGIIDMDLYGGIISNQSPDLVALQEVDKKTTRVGGLDLTEELSKITGLDGYFFKHRDYQGGEFGTAALSKFPVADIIIKDVFLAMDGSKTIHPFLKVKLDENVYIYFNNSHLSLDFEERKKQIEELVKIHKEELNDAPLLICGDLNTEPDSEEMQLLFEEFSVSDTLHLNTFSARTGLIKKIDYILLSKNDDWEIIDTKRICRTDGSDHCALFSELKLKIVK